jgi:hypothetical protein
MVEQEKTKTRASDAAWVATATRNAFEWVTKWTKTYNEHWQEEGRPGPNEHFPDKDYLAWYESVGKGRSRGG